MNLSSKSLPTKPKYGFTGKSNTDNVVPLYEIIALRDFGSVKKCDIGGFIESEQSLSHSGTCWVGQGCTVENEGRVSGNAIIMARTSGLIRGGRVSDNAILLSETLNIDSDTNISGSAVIKCTGVTQARGSHITDCATIYGKHIHAWYLQADEHARVNHENVYFEQFSAGGNATITGNRLTQLRFDSFSKNEYLYNDITTYTLDMIRPAKPHKPDMTPPQLATTHD